MAARPDEKLQPGPAILRDAERRRLRGEECDLAAVPGVEPAEGAAVIAEVVGLHHGGAEPGADRHRVAALVAARVGRLVGGAGPIALVVGQPLPDGELTLPWAGCAVQRADRRQRPVPGIDAHVLHQEVPHGRPSLRRVLGGGWHRGEQRRH